MTTVRTAHGDGEIIDSNTVRGRTTYKVAGDGFSVWLDETEVNKRTASDEHEASSSFDFEPTDHVWDNHTTLPYNWQPQFPVDMFRAEQTISPDHQIDLKERMHDSDSRTGEDREPTHTYPGPNPDLFAKKAWTFHDQDEESEPDRWEHLNEHAHGIEHAASHPEDPYSSYEGWEGQDRDNYTDDQDRDSYTVDPHWKHEPMIPPEHRAPEGEPSWQDHIQAEGDHQDHLNFGPHQPEHPDHLGAYDPGDPGNSSAGFELKSRHPGHPDSWPFKPNAVDYADWDKNHPEEKERYPEYFHASWERPAGLSSKYADIHEAADHFNDPVQRFRDDPQTAIQRHAYIDISAGLDHETGGWMDLVQADKQIRTAAWNDVRTKAMRLKRDGAVHVKDMSQDHIYANVDGDNGNYEVMILKGSSYGGTKGKPTGQSIADWKCSCFLADAPIMMADGTERPISELKPGDEVITHMGQIRRVVDIRPKLFDGQLTRVKTNGSYREFVATSEHRVYSALANRSFAGEDGWEEVGKLRAGDYLSQPTMINEQPVVVSIPRRPGHKITNKYGARGVQRFKARHGEKGKYGEERWTFTYKDGGRTGRPCTAYFYTREEAIAASNYHHAERAFIDVKIDAELAYWLGWYVAEGFLVKGPDQYRVGFALAADEGWVADQLDEISWSHFGVRGTRCYKGNVIDYRVSNHTLYRLTELLVGTGSYDKKLAQEMLNLPRAERQRFMAAWLYGDGAVSRNGHHSISTVSQTLAHQARELLARDGWKVGIGRQNSNIGGLATTQNAGPIYQIRWMTKADTVYQFERDGSVFQRIISIESESYSGEVWDIEVEGDHSFRAFGRSAHNCDWGKWAFKRKLTYVGRLCSHGYASYLTMQGEYAKEPKHPFRKRNGSIDDFKKWVKDENGDHIDTDAADSYLSTLETPATKEEAEKVYDYVEDHHTERPERDYDQDGYTNDPDEAYKTAADVLNHQPGKLTPHLYVVPKGEEQHFEDLGDDRKTTGPDQIMARVAKGEDAISEHHPDFAWHNKGQDDFPEQGIVHFSSLIYTADEDLINKLRDLSDDQPSEHFHDMQDHNREVSEVVEELHDRGYAAAPLVAMKRQAMWKTADDRLPGERDEDKGFSGLSPFDFSGGADSHSGPVSSGGGGDVSGLSKTLPFGPAGQGSGAGGGGSFLPQLTHDLGQAKPGAPSTPAATAGGGGFTPVAPGAHPTDQFSSSGISGGGYKEPNAGKPGYSQSGQSSIYDPNGPGPAAPAAKPTSAVAPPAAAVAPPAKAAPAPVAAPLGGAPRNNTAGPAVATPAPGAPGAAPPIHGAAQTLGTQGQPLTLTRDMGNYGPGNPYKGAQRFAERYFLADNDVHTDNGGDVHTDDKNKPGVGSSGLPSVTPSAGGPPPNGAVGKGGEDHYKVISPGGAQVNAPRPQAGLPTAPGPGVVTTPGGQGGQQAPGLAGAVGGPAGGGVGDVMSQLGPILNQIPGIGGALGGVMGMIPKGGSAQHFAAQYMYGAGSPSPMSNPAPAGKGKPTANQAAPATPAAPTAKPTAAASITGQIPNLLSGSGGGMGLASPTVGGMSKGLGGITKTLSAQHFARQYMAADSSVAPQWMDDQAYDQSHPEYSHPDWRDAPKHHHGPSPATPFWNREAGGDFLTKGGPNWMDYPFAGSGPDRQDFSGTSEDYVEEHERPNRQETWRTDNEGDIIKYTQTQPKQAALFAARYFYADGDIAGSGDAGYGAGGATHPGGADTYGGGIVHAPSSGSGSQDFATVGPQGGSTPTMGTMTNTAAISESSRQFWADAFSPGQSGYFNPTNRPFQNDDSAQPKKVPPGKGKPKTPGAPAPAGGPVEVPVPPGGALAEAAEAVPALATVASYGGDDSDVVRRFHAAGAGALGSPTGGSNGAYSDDAIATNARRMLRTAGRHFTRAEERELEDEFNPRGARNLGSLNLTGTHYLDED